MVTKDEFLERLQPTTCSLCLEPYDGEHVPVQLPECGHIFGSQCITRAVETDHSNNNRCPLCRATLFDQEDFDEQGFRVPDDELEPIEQPGPFEQHGPFMALLRAVNEYAAALEANAAQDQRPGNARDNPLEVNDEMEDWSEEERDVPLEQNTPDVEDSTDDETNSNRDIGDDEELYDLENGHEVHMPMASDADVPMTDSSSSQDSGSGSDFEPEEEDHDLDLEL